MTSLLAMPDADELLAAALAEDLGVDASRLAPPAVPDPLLLARDVTSALVPAGAGFSGRVVARQPMAVCGLPAAARAFELLAEASGVEAPEFFPLVAEGVDVGSGEAVAEVEGAAALVLAGERTALDVLAVLSGIATEARRWQRAAGDRLTVADTRKTYPGMRALSKYATAVGGAANHRRGLWDAVLLKDNHLRLAGGVRGAVGEARRRHPGLTVEVEADRLDQALEAVQAGADAVLLDNFDDAALTAAVAALREAADRRGAPVLLEASGGIRFERLAALAATGVDRVSSSAITFASPVDLGLDED